MGDDLARARGLAESLTLIDPGQMPPHGPASVGREILKLLDGFSSQQLTGEEIEALVIRLDAAEYPNHFVADLPSLATVRLKLEAMWKGSRGTG